MAIVSILSFSTPRYKVRIWRSKPYEPTGFTDIQVYAMHLQDKLPLVELAESLLAQDSVVQVEVIDWDNNGVQCSK